MKNTKKQENEFHAVEFMRQARTELTETYLHDREKYLNFLKVSLEEFKVRQRKAIELQ